ncbi:MAG: hypothetical protein H0X42_04400 [Solirubrobacterales bacterium]|nr:hypothetical protein [Solirubrobacterales bacterium]
MVSEHALRTGSELAARLLGEWDERLDAWTRMGARLTVTAIDDGRRCAREVDRWLATRRA